MKEIPLSRGLVALVDDEDYEQLAKHKWTAQRNRKMRSFYAVRHEHPYVDGKRKTQEIAMHRQILGLLPGDPRKGGHVEPGQMLDNRRDNLRITSYDQSMRNCRRHRDNVSGYKGVSPTKRGQYSAFIYLNGRQKYLGIRPTPGEAHELYKAAAREAFGEFARFE